MKKNIWRFAHAMINSENIICGSIYDSRVEFHATKDGLSKALNVALINDMYISVYDKTGNYFKMAAHLNRPLECYEDALRPQ